MALLCATRFGVRRALRDLLRDRLHLARLVLACLFLHHVVATLTRLGDGPASPSVGESLFVLVRASLIACVGVAATGAFWEDSYSKERAERAERKAKEESMMAQAMADSMVVLTHELRTPLQG